MKAAKSVAPNVALAIAGVLVLVSSIESKTYASSSNPIPPQDSQANGASAPLSKDWKVIFPEDPNKFLVITTCNNCHGLEQIVTRRGDKGFWSDIVYTMVSNGADIQDEDAAKLIKYFSTYLDESKPLLKVPVNVNTATADVLRLLPPIAANADDIVKKREELKGFQKIDDLLQVKGLNKEDLDKVRAFLSVGH